MPIPTAITDLSTTAASNYPAGSDSPSVLDDVQRAHAAFIAGLRDDPTANALVATPVAKGGTGATSAAAARTALGVAPRATRIDVASVAGTVDLTTNAPDSDDIRITGALAITAFTIAVGRVIRVTAGGAFTLTNSASIVTQTGANIVAASGDTFMIRATAANVVEVLSYVPATTASTSMPVPVRQTVLSGPVDTNGFAAFGGSTGSTTVTATGTLVATAANGFGSSGQVDRVGSIINPSWTGLSTNGTMHLYLDIAANGTCTTGSTTVAPNYRWGGADVTTNDQFTFNIQEMVGKVGDGSVTTQTYRVFVGEVTVSGSVVTAITWYALMGRYTGAWVNTLPGTNVQVSISHNLGFADFTNGTWDIKNLSSDIGYQSGDIVTNVGSYNGNSSNTPGVAMRKNTAIMSTSNAGVPWAIYSLSTGANSSLTLGNWAYRVRAQRTW